MIYSSEVYSQQMKRIKLINMGDIRLIQLISCEVKRNAVMRRLLPQRRSVVCRNRACPCPKGHVFSGRRNNFLLLFSKI